MGKEQDASFYDENIARFLVPYEESNWKLLYDAVADIIPKDNPAAKILDVGCGTGRLAVALKKRGLHNYTGFDFSPKRLEEAARYLPDLPFHCLDAFSVEAKKLYAESDIICVTEVLEHLNRDRELLELLPAGCQVVFSVPNFDAPAHVRHFATLDDVVSRFGDQIAIDHGASRVLKKARNTTFLLIGIKR